MANRNRMAIATGFRRHLPPPKLIDGRRKAMTRG